MAIFVTIGFCYHFIQFLIGHFLSKSEHNVSKFFDRNKAIVILVEYSKEKENLFWNLPLLKFGLSEKHAKFEKKNLPHGSNIYLVNVLTMRSLRKFLCASQKVRTLKVHLTISDNFFSLLYVQKFILGDKFFFQK